MDRTIYIEAYGWVGGCEGRCDYGALKSLYGSLLSLKRKSSLLTFLIKSLKTWIASKLVLQVQGMCYAFFIIRFVILV